MKTGRRVWQRLTSWATAGWVRGLALQGQWHGGDTMLPRQAQLSPAAAVVGQGIRQPFDQRRRLRHGHPDPSEIVRRVVAAPPLSRLAVDDQLPRVRIADQHVERVGSRGNDEAADVEVAGCPQRRRPVRSGPPDWKCRVGRQRAGGAEDLPPTNRGRRVADLDRLTCQRHRGDRRWTAAELVPGGRSQQDGGDDRCSGGEFASSRQKEQGHGAP